MRLFHLHGNSFFRNKKRKKKEGCILLRNQRSSVGGMGHSDRGQHKSRPLHPRPTSRSRPNTSCCICVQLHGLKNVTTNHSPSNSAGPTPTMMMDMGRDAACGDRTGVRHVHLWGQNKAPPLLQPASLLQVNKVDTAK